MSKKDDGTVSIHGKSYKTVALRVSEFRADYPDYSIVTEIHSLDDKTVVMKASISDNIGRVIGTGFAEEARNASQINKTSALENCETSAIGRALAAIGLAGTEYASANEVENAIHQQNAAFTPEQKEEFNSYVMLRDPLGVYLKGRSIGEKAYVAIYNSYPSGAKSAVKATIDELYAMGQEVLANIEHGLKEGDDYLVLENIDGMSNAVKRLLVAQIGEEGKAQINETKERAKEDAA